MRDMIHAGLVLEGGGMKGFFTIGVLDYFMERGILFSDIYGVSAGACHLTGYVSGQKGRQFDVCSDYLDTRRYCSPYSLLTSGDLFHAKIVYSLVPKYLNPFDYDAFRAFPGRAYAVVTNIETGEPEYPRLRDLEKDMIWVQASASLPLVSRNVRVGDGLYLDGGISDAIPIRRAHQDGLHKCVVVLTKEVGYVRKPTGKANLALLRARYLRYPKVPELMKDRHIRYAQTLDYLEQSEKDGTAFVIRPQRKSDVARIEKDVDKLKLLYKEGYEEAERCFGRMMEYLGR